MGPVRRERQRIHSKEFIKQFRMAVEIVLREDKKLLEELAKH